MTIAEFESWREFYKLFPFDDFHRFHRPAALQSTPPGENFGDRLGKVLEWLQPDPLRIEHSDADLATFKAFGITPPRKKG